MSTSSNYGASLTERLQNPAAHFREALKAYTKSVRVAMPATVVSFDAAKQTVVVQPAIREIERIAGVITTVGLPQLVDVPVMLPRAGGYTLTMPIAAGDECLVIFADSCIDAWWQSGGEQNQAEQRRHHLADGFAILGPWNQTRVLSSYSTSSAQLRADGGGVVIDLAASQITVTAPTIKLNATTEIDLNAPTININGTSSLNISTNT